MHSDLLQWCRADIRLRDALASTADDVDEGDEWWPLIYWVALPRNAKKRFPAMTLTGISRDNQADQKSEGNGELIGHRIQVDIYSDDPLSARTAMDAVLHKFDLPLNKYKGTTRVTYGSTVFCKILFDSERDMPVTQADGNGVDIFHISGDFIIWHRPLVGGNSQGDQ